MPSPLRNDLIQRLDAAADPERAIKQQSYMKSTMPYHGVMAPEMRRIARAVFGDHPISDADEWEATVLERWREASHREQRYVAIELADLTRYRQWLDPSRVPMIEEMIVSGAWWDLVDHLAVVPMARLLSGFSDEIRPTLWRWTTDDDMWRRRTSIIVQNRFKTATDTELLFRAIESSMDSKEFFLRKAIGWALREYSKSAPQVVVDYVTTNADQLSGLSKREALKVLRKQGVVDENP